MLGYLFILNYVVAAVALWRLWPSDYTALWWCILVSGVMQFLSNVTVRTAYRDEMGKRVIENQFEHLWAHLQVKDDTVVRFWVRASMLFTAGTLVLSVVGLVLTF